METSTVEQKLWTTLSLLNWSVEYLTLNGFDSPRLATELLLAHVLRCSRVDLYTNFDRPLSKAELVQFKALFKRRLAHEPLQYILGETEFMGLKFIVDKRVLIPRPETEVLVEQIINLSKQVQSYQILDIGTGSGNIAISLAKYIGMCEVDAIDVSDDALAVAEQNLKLHHLERKIRLLQGDVLQENITFRHQQYDVIVSNPPYISQDEFASLQPEVKEYEPTVATTDGRDGLTFYRAITKIGKTRLVPGGWVFVEFAYNQSDAVSALFDKAGYSDVEVIPDYSRILRILKARWS